jgi:cytidylate kinase
MRGYRSPSLDKIVGKHLQMWEIRKEVGVRREREEQIGPAVLGPYLTISRLPSSGGEEVARLCAERLGWVLFDREIVDHIARNARTLGKFVTSLDERSRSAMDDWLQTALDTRSLGQASYLRHLKRVLVTVALHGNAVILGRGANFILPADAGLRVHVTAPAEMRSALLAENRKLSPAEAQRELKRLDAQREDFLSAHFPDAERETDHYDLIVNMSAMSPEEAATLIVDSFFTLDRRAAAPASA